MDRYLLRALATLTVLGAILLTAVIVLECKC